MWTIFPLGVCFKQMYGLYRVKNLCVNVKFTLFSVSFFKDVSLLFLYQLFMTRNLANAQVSAQQQCAYEGP